MATSSASNTQPETTIVPAWPFLVANHELGRVDYRTLVAPDFLADQECEQVLSSLPLAMDEESIHSCYVTYRSANGETCKVGVLYKIMEISGESFFPIKPQRQVQIIVGLVFTLRYFHLSLSPELLQESFQLYEEDYRQFCHSTNPRDFPVTVSWPLAAPRATPLTVTSMPEQDTTRLQPRQGAYRSAKVVPQQRAERAFPISRSQVMEQITQETFFTRLLRLFRWRRSRPSVKGDDLPFS